MTIEEQDGDSPLWGSWEKVVSFDPTKATVRPVISSQGSKAFIVGLEPGQQLRSHPAPADLYLFVVQGSVTFTIADQVNAVNLGDCVLMKKGVPHAIYNSQEARAAVLGVTLPLSTVSR